MPHNRQSVTRMKVKSLHRVKPHTKVRLSHFPASDTGHYQEEKEAQADLQLHLGHLDRLQGLLAACNQHAVLVVLQGMDTGGKDGTIRSIFSGVNPQGCTVTSFKVPTPLEARHDFLWRVHAAVPPKGMIGIFNRSHYEDVLVVRVHNQISGKEAHRRMDEIVDWEEMLAANGVIILKFFLHISYEEQTRRLAARLDDPKKQWKISDSDFAERKLWPDYQLAYEDALSRTSRKHAPWFIVPADHKWYRNVAISEVLVQTLEDLKMKYPKSTVDLKNIKLD
jgi:PPK2 family polyphosphate:nucleotide phosphotransferase